MKLAQLHELTLAQMDKASDIDSLVRSIMSGKFTLDGSDLICPDDGLSLRGHKMLSLVGAPKEVGSVYAAGSRLTSLKGVPEKIGTNLNVGYNRIASFKDVHKQIKHVGRVNRALSGIITTTDNPVMSHVLGFLLIPGIRAVDAGNAQYGGILTSAIKQYPGEDAKSLKQRLVYASRRLIDEVPVIGRDLARV